jgi:hypothetical protein
MPRGSKAIESDLLKAITERFNASKARLTAPASLSVTENDEYALRHAAYIEGNINRSNNIHPENEAARVDNYKVLTLITVLSNAIHDYKKNKKWWHVFFR